MFVNRLLGSKIFWSAMIALACILYLTKGSLSKTKEILRLMAKLAVNLVALFLGLFGIQFIKFFEEVEGGEIKE